MLAALKLSRPLVAGLIVLGLLLLASFGFWCGMAAIDRMEQRAADAARAERDAHWRAEIEQANAAVERVKAEQATRVAQIEVRTAAEIARLNAELDDLEKMNAALPNADACGLDRDRSRLLNGAR